jgi:hypothetical protein
MNKNSNIKSFLTGVLCACIALGNIITFVGCEQKNKDVVGTITNTKEGGGGIPQYKANIKVGDQFINIADDTRTPEKRTEYFEKNFGTFVKILKDSEVGKEIEGLDALVASPSPKATLDFLNAQTELAKKSSNDFLDNVKKAKDIPDELSQKLTASADRINNAIDNQTKIVEDVFNKAKSPSTITAGEIADTINKINKSSESIAQLIKETNDIVTKIPDTPNTKDVKKVITESWEKLVKFIVSQKAINLYVSLTAIGCPPEVAVAVVLADIIFDGKLSEWLDKILNKIKDFFEDLFNLFKGGRAQGGDGDDISVPISSLQGEGFGENKGGISIPPITPEPNTPTTGTPKPGTTPPPTPQLPKGVTKGSTPIDIGGTKPTKPGESGVAVYKTPDDEIVLSGITILDDGKEETFFLQQPTAKSREFQEILKQLVEKGKNLDPKVKRDGGTIIIEFDNIPFKWQKVEDQNEPVWQFR